MIESKIINSCLLGDGAAFKKLYESCAPYAFSIIRRYVFNPSDHKDVLQEVFARVFLSLKNFDKEKGAFKTWFRKLTVNQCLLFYRNTNHKLKLVPLEIVGEKQELIEENQFDLTKEEIERILHKMPEGYKVIFMLVIIDEYSHVEVGELLDISPETSRSQLFRAKKWIRKRIKSSTSTIRYGLL